MFSESPNCIFIIESTLFLIIFCSPTANMPAEISKPITSSGLSLRAAIAKSPVPVAISIIFLTGILRSCLIAFLRQILSIPKERK